MIYTDTPQATCSAPERAEQSPTSCCYLVQQLQPQESATSTDMQRPELLSWQSQRGPCPGKQNWHLCSEAAETHSRAQLLPTLSFWGCCSPIPTLRLLPTLPQSSAAAAATAADPCGFAMAADLCGFAMALWYLLAAPHLQPSACFEETLTPAALSFQHPRSCPTFPPAQPLLSLGTPQGPGDSLNTQGT